ncbi:MAG TPA: xanthine dehydrogenase family protein molybdopterin-binding subunit [Rhizomicrobium sp.]|nr:xanthine dehydrogenase family protein molybdopterin-binding subunit [Rhizomicrobium sp.]
MAYNLIGKDFTPMDVEAKVTGRAKYAEDFRADNMVFCKTLTSPIPHAKIKSIDTSAALKIKGVIGVLTADDVPQFPPPALPILAKDEVFYVGDPILAVAAESEELCADAIEAIKIDFEQLPHVVDPLESLFPGGPNARTAGNVAAGQIKLQTVKWDAADFAAAGDAKMPMGRAAEEWAYGDVDAGFKNAKVTIEETFVTGTYSHNCMETRSTFAYWQGGKCFLHGSNQSHTAAIANIARYIDIPPENLVFIAEYCGGGFGSKIPGYPNMAIAALMSKKINRPVMHRITRTDEYGIGAARPGFQGYIKMGFRADGKLLAADMYLVQESGPHATAGDFRAAGNALTMMYQPDACKFRSVPVLTNTVPMGAHRGPGENQFAALVEPMFDKAAKQLNIDRIAIRRINAPDNSGKIGKDRGPLTSAFQKEALDKAAMMFKWAERKKSSGQKNGNKVTGIGIGQGYHSAGTNGFDGLLRITSDGKLHVHTGIGNLGTYSHSATARVAADLMNCDWENVVIERGDTRKGLPFNSPQAGSLSASTQSRTMYAAAMAMKDMLTDIAAKTHGGQPADYVLGKEKVVHKSDASKSLSFQQAAEKAVALGGKYSGKEVPDDLNAITKQSVAMIAGSGLIAAAKDNMPRVGVTPGLSVSMAEIELDTETGKFEIKDMICVADCGTVLHPLGLGHQISGGNVMGIGMVMERHIYDPKLGIPASVGFHQGKLPTYLDVPVEVGWGAVEKPDPQNPIGVKGVGEPVLGSGASAITSAIADALGGHLFNRTPVTPDMIINHLAGRPPAHKPLQVNTV